MRGTYHISHICDHHLISPYNINTIVKQTGDENKENHQLYSLQAELESYIYERSGLSGRCFSGLHSMK